MGVEDGGHRPRGLGGVPVEDLAAQLGSGPDGLTSEEAARRLAADGPNAVEERRRNPALVFLGYFWAPIPWLIEAALVLSIVLQHWPDAVIIAVLLAMNGLVAYREEHEAADTVAALKKSLAATARVRRDGEWADLPVRDLVVGDLVHLQLGDIVPADGCVWGGAAVSVDQSALTGESLPVSKARGEEVYSGSVLARGQTDALVTATGAESFFGRTTALVGAAGTASHFQRAVLRIGQILIYAALVLVAATTASSLLRGDTPFDAIEFALVVIIASVPVAMPAVLSVTMAVGARRLASQKAVVSHLPAVEELGGIDVLCADKTGTLTQNLIRVGTPWSSPGTDPGRILRAAALASDPSGKDAIDLAVLAAAPPGWQAADGTTASFTPFDPTSKRSEAAVVPAGSPEFRVTKGAPQVIARLCEHEDAATARAYSDQVGLFAQRGDRALGVAERRGGGWRLLGLLPLADPPREDSAATVRAAEELGVEVKMVTGDALAIGQTISAAVGIGPNLLPASRLAEPERDGRGDEALARLVEDADGFAQVFPEHKYRIVKALQSRGHIVGMTGDGVNDAAALKQADAGIAVSGATDAARAAADVVLLAPGLSVIVGAIRLAREMFARMTSYTVYRIAETIRVLLLVTVTVVAFNFRPVTAAMIVILALLNDGALLAIAYDRAHGSARPARWDLRQVLTVASSLGILGVLETLGLLVLGLTVLGLNTPEGHGLLETMVFLKLSVSGHLTVFVARTKDRFWKSPAPSTVLLVAVVGAQIVATAIALTGFLMTPLTWTLAAVVWVWSAAWFLVEDQVKVAAYAFLRRTGSGPAPAS
ncbi:plasma-membrane proton-efflux P-type ATPase [Sinomonas soli]